MKNFLGKVFTKRSVLGTLFLIALIGEPTVGTSTGLFTPGGIVVFFFLYLSLFHLFESLITRYKLVVFQVILLTFAIYAVLVTGFLNKEITEYILKPNLFITLIRIQASFFVAFAFYLLNPILPRKVENVLSIKQSLIFFTVFVLIISASKVWGLSSVLFTLKITPGLALLFGLLAITASVVALKSHPIPTFFQSRKLTIFTWICFVLGMIPTLFTFIVLVIVMIAGGIYLLVNKSVRNLSL